MFVELRGVNLTLANAAEKQTVAIMHQKTPSADSDESADASASGNKWNEVSHFQCFVISFHKSLRTSRNDLSRNVRSFFFFFVEKCHMFLVLIILEKTINFITNFFMKLSIIGVFYLDVKVRFNNRL